MARKSPSKDKDVVSAIESGTIDPIYCLHGGERYLVDRCVRALRQAIVGDQAQATALNYDVFELKDTPLSTALSCARTLPMLARNRLVVARGIDLVKADALAPLLQYLEDPNPKACLVLLTDKADKVDGRLRVFAALKKAGYLHEFGRLSDRELPRWVTNEARLRKVDIDGEAAQALAEAAGPDLGRLAQAIEQLALFAARPGEPTAQTEKTGQAKKTPPRVSAADVETLIPESRQRQIYELTRAIARQDDRQAVALVAALFRSGELPARQMALRLQGSLLFQLRRIWRARELLAAGTPTHELASALGVPPFAVDELVGPARRLSAATLAADFNRLYRADRVLKSSRIDPEVYLIRLVRNLCGAHA